MITVSGAVERRLGHLATIAADTRVARRWSGVTRTDQGETWRHVATLRKAAGDREGALRAYRSARLVESPLRFFCFRCRDRHTGPHDCHQCLNRQQARQLTR
jgi:hypothetical protein